MSGLFNKLNKGSTQLAMGALVVALAGGFVLSAHAAPAGGMQPMGMMGAGPMGGPMGDHAGGSMFGGPFGGRMLDAVNATAEQRSQIKSIMDTARTELKSQRDAGRTVRDQMRQAFTQPTVDANVVESLRKQLLAQHDAASKRMMQAMLDVSRVLTPEQRSQLAALMAQRQGMMERHRAERDSLNRPK